MKGDEKKTKRNKHETIKTMCRNVPKNIFSPFLSVRKAGKDAETISFPVMASGYVELHRARSVSSFL